MKFIHTADLHVDSPLRGLEAYEGAPVERLRGATRRAMENVVALAIEQHVDFVLVAGDLFDGPWPDMQTGLWTAGQFRRLEDEGIDVFLLRGNHDAESQVRKALTWPENVKEFSVRQAQTFELEASGQRVALHGQGFPNRAVPEDLAADYPPPVAGAFNIGLLHTSLTGSAQHDTYAPTTRDALLGRGYDYWALGHIHQQQTIADDQGGPYIAFCGNTQGRHVNEAGAKGCLLAKVEDGRLSAVDFHETDVVRWLRAEVTLDEDDVRSDLFDKARAQLTAQRDAHLGRLCAVRLTIAGACRAHATLIERADRETVVAELRNIANDLHEDVWLERVELQTTPRLDLDQLRQGNDLLGEMLRHLQQTIDDPDALAQLSECFAPLAERAARELADAGVKLDDTERLRAWLADAETLLLAQLIEASP